MHEPFTPAPIRLIGEDGVPTAGAEIDLSEAELRRLYRDMLRAREFDQKLVTLLRQGRTSFYAQSSGMEATQIGLAHALRPGHDWLWTYYRDQGLALALGMSMLDLLSQILGTNSDPNRGRQMPQHYGTKALNFVSTSSSIANQVPAATGTAMAQKYLGTDEITVCTFGDGATSEGDWHAGLNMAGVSGAPCLFVCENNQWAISLGVSGQTASENIHIKAKAYGMPGYYVDGNDVLAVRSVMRQVAADIRAGKGPALVECLTYRYGAHSNADSDAEKAYRDREELNAWLTRDPILRFERFLEHQGLGVSAEEKRELSLGFQREVDEAVLQAEASGVPGWNIIFEDVYADVPVHLRAQYAELQAEQEALA